MAKRLLNNYRRFNKNKQKKTALKRFFNAFLPEVVYRSTKIEHEGVSRKQVQSYLR